MFSNELEKNPHKNTPLNFLRYLVGYFYSEKSNYKS